VRTQHRGPSGLAILVDEGDVEIGRLNRPCEQSPERGLVQQRAAPSDEPAHAKWLDEHQVLSRDSTIQLEAAGDEVMRRSPAFRWDGMARSDGLGSRGNHFTRTFGEQ
jgi:hypothetical protein